MGWFQFNFSTNPRHQSQNLWKTHFMPKMCLLVLHETALIRLDHTNLKVYYVYVLTQPLLSDAWYDHANHMPTQQTVAIFKAQMIGLAGHHLTKVHTIKDYCLLNSGEEGLIVTSFTSLTSLTKELCTIHSLLERLLREKNDQLTSQIQIMKILCE